jgi:hypothetical protein
MTTTLRDVVRETLKAPWLRIGTNDNLCSSILIKGSFDPQDDWQGGIWHNGRGFMLSIMPPKNQRWYKPGDKVSVELLTSHGCTKFRKYTATPEKVIAKIQAWIESQ